MLLGFLFFSAVNGITIDVFERQPGDGIIGGGRSDNLLLVRTEYGAGEGSYSVLERDNAVNEWVNTTVTLGVDKFGLLPDFTSPRYIKVLDHRVVFIISNDVAPFYTLASFDWDTNTKTFGDPVFIRLSGSQGAIEKWGVSLNGNIVVITDHTESHTKLYTYRHTGSAWVAAPTVTNSFSTQGLQVHNGFMVYGDTSAAGNPAFTYGQVHLRRWSGTAWGAVETTWYCPARPDVARKCDKFGQEVWMSEDESKLLVSAPDSSDSTNAANANAGAYVTFIQTDNVWSSGSIIFPYKFATGSARYGKFFATTRDAVYIYDDAGLVIIGDVNHGTLSNTYLSYSFSNALWSSDTSGGATLTQSDALLVFNEKHNTVPDPKMKVIESPITDVNGDYFGSSIKINGDFMAVSGTAATLSGSTSRGYVRMYEKDLLTNTWALVDTVSPPAGLTEAAAGYAADISFDGSTLVVAAASEDLSGTNDGAVYVYDWDGTTLSLNTKLVSPVAESAAKFGESVAVSGNTIVVGANYFDSEGVTSSGAVIVFTKVGGVWDSGEFLQLTVEGDYPAASFSNKRLGSELSFDGTTIIAKSLYTTPSSTGLLNIYTHNGTHWTLDQQLEGETLDSTSFIMVSVSGNFIAASATGTNRKVISIYEKVGGTWVFKEILEDSLIQATSETIGGASLEIVDNVLIVDDNTDPYAGSNTGMALVFVYDGSTWDNADRRELYSSDPVSGGYFGRRVSTDGSNIAVSEGYHSTSTVSNSGRVSVLNLFETCTVSSTCSENKYCSPEELCVTPITCAQHTDCIGEFITGRLPYCNPTTLKCQDKFAGSCANTQQCRNKVSEGTRATSGIAFAKLSVVTTDMAKSTQATNEVITRTKATVVDDSKLNIAVKGTETIEFDPTTYASDPTFADKVKAARCSDSVDQCTVTVDEGAGRRLQTSNVTITITYTFDDESYSTTSGFNFDDPAFLQALADSLGVNTTELDVSGDTSGNVVVEVTLLDESNGSDPLSTNLLDQIDAINADMATIGSDLATELGLDPSDIVSSSPDYCAERDCSGAGTCDPSTGVCTCNDPALWGINCETDANCVTGTLANGYCSCVYPKYGQRCNTDKTECSETCGA